MTNNNTNKQLFYPGVAILGCMALACMFTIGTGLLIMLNLDHFTLNKLPATEQVYKTGIEVWGTAKLSLWLAMVSWFWLAMLLIYKKVRCIPKLGASFMAFIIIVIVAILFSPQWQDLQIRVYKNPAETTSYIFGSRSFPLIAHIITSDKQTWYSDDYKNEETYNCDTQYHWKILGLNITNSFYPNLDRQNHHQLLKDKCSLVE